jgi:hypothetical protein
MKREEVKAAIEAEIGKFSASLNKVPLEQVRSLYAKMVSENGPGRVALQGLRVEVSAAIQALNPPPHTHDPEDAAGSLTEEERDALHEASAEGVADHHRTLADRARRLDPNHSDAHHFVQKLHGTAVWREVDRVIAEAGIGAGGAS